MRIISPFLFACVFVSVRYLYHKINLCDLNSYCVIWLSFKKYNVIPAKLSANCACRFSLHYISLSVIAASLHDMQPRNGRDATEIYFHRLQNSLWDSVICFAVLCVVHTHTRYFAHVWYKSWCDEIRYDPISGLLFLPVQSLAKY